MARSTIERRVDAMRCSRPSFARLCGVMLECTGSDTDGKLEVSLWLPKDRQLRGAYTPEQLSNLAEVDEAQRIHLKFGGYGDPVMISFSISDAGASNKLTVEAETLEDAEHALVRIEEELRQRRPWWWFLKFSNLNFAFVAVTLAAAIASLLGWIQFIPDSVQVPTLLIVPAVSAISFFLPRLRIGSPSPSKAKLRLYSAAKFLGAAVIGALVTKLIDLLLDGKW